MCGIAGIIRLDGAHLSEDADGKLLQTLARQMAHRGPDDEQILIHANVGLAFRRLSIIDLKGGQQPLFNSSGSIATICNGEIYNHKDLRSRLLSFQKLKTNSDCEVIPHLYDRMGMDFISELNGIFAFALLDKQQKKLILCRDRLGVKPLFYYHDKSNLIFGSEVKAVLAHPNVPREFDWEAALTVRRKMLYPHRDYGLSSFFKGINQLSAGHFLEIDLSTGSLNEQVYWNPSASSDSRRRSPHDRQIYINKYHDLLQDAVEMQLMADVECGIFLSGGIDSVTVAHFAAKHRPVHTFSVLSQSTLGNGDAPSAFAAAKAFGVPNHMVLFDWRKVDIDPELWRTILWKVETPIAEAEQYYKFLLHSFARTRVPGLKVMLLGSGSDEFNGGYSRSVYNTVEDPSWRNFEQVMARFERESLLQLSGASSRLTNLEVDERPLISRRFLADLAHQSPYETPWDGYPDMYRRVLQMYQLWHEDRTSSAHGIEARVPFLDHRLVELTYSVPPALHEDLFWDKAILREAMKSEMDAQFCQRPKTPFFYGEDVRYTHRLVYNMLCAHNYALIEEAIEASPGFTDMVDKDVLWRMIHDLPTDPEYTNIEPVFDLINMGLLASMARDPNSAPERWDGDLPIEEAVIGDWSTWEHSFGATLVQRMSTLNENSIIGFVDGICLVKQQAGDPNVAFDGGYWILRDGALEFMVDAKLEGWVQFLRHIDGRKSVSEILGDVGLTAADIWKHLEEAIEYKVLHLNPDLPMKHRNGAEHVDV
jgi:asparagine synthase (glutamine-hydrolysing)